MTKSCDAGEDLVGRLRPHEGLGGGIVEGDVVRDGGLQGMRAPMGAALDLFLGQRREPAFDQVEPRTAGGREVEMKAGPLDQPPMDPRRLVGPVVIENQLDVERCGAGRGDRIEELAELEGPVPPMERSDDPATVRVEGGKERGRPMTDMRTA